MNSRGKLYILDKSYLITGSLPLQCSIYDRNTFQGYHDVRAGYEWRHIIPGYIDVFHNLG